MFLDLIFFFRSKRYRALSLVFLSGGEVVKVTMQVPAVTKDTVTRTIKPYYRKEYIVAVQVSYNSQMPI